MHTSSSLETNHFKGIAGTNISFSKKNYFDRLLRTFIYIYIYLSAVRGSIVHYFLWKLNLFAMSPPLGPHSLFYELAACLRPPCRLFSSVEKSRWIPYCITSCWISKFHFKKNSSCWRRNYKKRKEISKQTNKCAWWILPSLPGIVLT